METMKLYRLPLVYFILLPFNSGLFLLNFYLSFLFYFLQHVIVEAEMGIKTIKRSQVKDVDLFVYLLDKVCEALITNCIINFEWVTAILNVFFVTRLINPVH